MINFEKARIFLVPACEYGIQLQYDVRSCHSQSHETLLFFFFGGGGLINPNQNVPHVTLLLHIHFFTSHPYTLGVLAKSPS
jgi:hypothetical protein